MKIITLAALLGLTQVAAVDPEPNWEFRAINYLDGPKTCTESN